MSKLTILPRILRASQAPGYLGMCRDVFNNTVRPFVREFPIGQQGVGFDRIELDQWADAYILANSIDKRMKAESSPIPFTTQPAVSRRKKRGPDVADLATSTSGHKTPTSEEFYRLVAEIMGKPATKNDHRRKKQEPPEPPNED